MIQKFIESVQNDAMDLTQCSSTSAGKRLQLVRDDPEAGYVFDSKMMDEEEQNTWDSIVLKHVDSEQYKLVTAVGVPQLKKDW